MVRRLKSDLRAAQAGDFPRRKVLQVDVKGLPVDAPELSIDAFARTLKAHRTTKRSKSVPVQADFALLREAPGAGDEEAANLSPEELTEAEEAQVALATQVSGDFTPAELAVLDQMTKIAEDHRHLPAAKVKALIDWVKANCLDGDRWNERRVIVFTEYMHSLNVLKRHLEEQLPDIEDRVGTFMGSVASSRKREELKEAFKSHPSQHPLRILLCTDAAREGVNLQVVFEDVGFLDESTLHLHLEQRLVQRLLGRFLSQGFAHDDLARVCAVVTPSGLLEWLGYAQPVGLVVTAPALVQAGVRPDKNIAIKQEELKTIVGEAHVIPDVPSC